MGNSDKPENDKNRLYTLPLPYTYDLIIQNDNQIIMAKDLLNGFMTGDKVMGDKIFFILIEILFACSSVLKLLEQEIETAVFYKNEDSGEKELIIPRSSIQTLETLLLSKYHAIGSLNKLSHSISLH
tara:strand:+ start:585 stop:965 length:381 start_codon:yes stop_codon:yes gene_type:complete